MTTRGVLKVVLLTLGGLVVAGVAGFYLMPRACGCSEAPDPERLVGLTGQELAVATIGCGFGIPAEAPRDELTWWTIVGEPRHDGYSGPWSNDIIWELEAVPYGSTDARPETIRTTAALGTVVTEELPAGTFTQHIAVLADEEALIRTPVGIAETTWGAAFFTGDCADVGLRETRQGTLSDADVAAWPSLTASELEALYGPPPAEPRPITADALGQAASAPTTPAANVSVTIGGHGEMPAGDTIWLVSADGLLHQEPITGLTDMPTVGVGAPVALGETVGVVLERDGRYYLLERLEVPHVLPPDTGIANDVTVSYVDVQTLEPLGGGEPTEVPGVRAAGFYAN